MPTSRFGHTDTILNVDGRFMAARN